MKNEYGIGGAYPAISGRNLDESHDAKGIKISRGRISQPDAEMLLRWNKAERRIGELIRADRYLSQAEKDNYPAYREQAEARRKRGEISEEFRSIVYDYNDFVAQLGEESKALNLYYLSSCWGAFSVGEKKMHARTAEGDFILPMMCEAMNTIIADNTHLSARCEAMLEALNSDVAKPLEPTFDELNPPPEPRKEYRYHLGDTVYIGTQEYELLSFNEKKVVLFDTQFPLFNKELTREEFDNRLKENPLNDKLLRATITEVHVPKAGRPNVGGHPLCLGCQVYRTGLVGNVVDDVQQSFPVMMAKALGGDGFTTPIDPSKDEIYEWVRRAESYTSIVIGTYNGHLHPQQLEMVKALAQNSGKPVTVVALRNPYDLFPLPESVYSLAAYEYTARSTAAVADVLLGRQTATGRLPIATPEQEAQ